MIELERILGSLEKVRKQGKGYIACCPVHGDNNPSMSIKEAEDKILMYCHACGAKGPEIVQALGLKPDVLFDKPFKTEYDRHWLLNKKADWDETMIMMAHETLKQGKTIGYNDYKQIKESLARREQRRKLNLPIIFNMDIAL